MENKSVDPTTATDEPNELLNVRLLQDEEQDDAKKRAAKKLSQNVLDESSSYSRKRQAWATLFATLGCFLNGGAIGYTGQANQYIMAESHDLYGNRLNASFQSVSWITGLLSMGAFFGVLVSDVVMDQIGRRRTLLTFTTASYLAGYALIFAACNEYMIWAGRFVCGVAMGSNLNVVTTYVTEISKRDIRGALGFLVQLMSVLGILYTFVAGYFLDWKWLAVANAVWILPFFLCVLLAPESPRWLVFKGRQYSASRSLGWLRGRGRPAEIEREIEMIKAELQIESRQRFSITLLSRHWRPFLLSLALMFFLNFSGLHVLLCYSSTVFSMSGNPAVDPRISTIVLGAAVLLSCLASIVVVSRLRNHLRYLIVWSVFGMAMAQMALAMCFLYNERREEALNTEVVHDGFGNSTIYDQIEEDDPLPVHVRWLPLFAVLGFMLVGNIGYGTLIWLVTTRLLPAPIARVGKGAVVGFSFACGFVVIKTYADLVESVGNSGAFFLYSAICLVGFIFCFLFLPETVSLADAVDGDENDLTDVGCFSLVKRNVCGGCTGGSRGRREGFAKGAT